MLKFGKTSLAELGTCDLLLQDVLNVALVNAPVDFSVVCGHRGEEAQNKAVAEGKSKLTFPNSRHNSYPSQAVDVCPYVAGRGLVWDDMTLWHTLADHILATAKSLGVRLRWGGDWDGDGLSRWRGDLDEKFIDLPHFELKRR